MFGLMAMFVVPSCLLVCTMWIDVASAGLTRTKAQRQAMQKKVRCGMITASVILSAMFALLAILDMRQEVSYLCVLVFVVTGSLYTYGGKTGIRSLSKGPLETTTTPPKPQPPQHEHERRSRSRRRRRRRLQA